MPSAGLSYFQTIPVYDAGWHVTGAQAGRRRLVTTKEGSPYATFTSTKTVATNPSNVLLMSFITPPLAAQTLLNTGFLKGVLQVACSGAALASAQLICKVWNNSATTLIGTPIPMHALALSNDFSTSLTNRKFPLNWGGSGAAFTGSSLALSEGSFIEISIGARMYTAATGGTVSVRLGDPNGGVDLAENETDTIAGTPWFEFSQTLVFCDQALQSFSPLSPQRPHLQGAPVEADTSPARVVNPPLQGGDLPAAAAATYYKMQASCTTSPTGYITWVNTTGDNQGRPVCGGILGDTVEVARWAG